MDDGGFTLRGFTDFELIGSGGSGDVYRARQSRLDRLVAIKVVRVLPEGAPLRHFERERRALGWLSGHPNIVTVHDADLTPAGRPYIVMEYLPDGTLADRLERGPLGWAEAATIGVKLSAALEFAHKAGVLHLDVKPENVFVSGDDVKLGDFGIARVVGLPETTGDDVLGTIVHMAPERLDDTPVTPASDVYSLCSTIFRLVCGHAPFERGDDSAAQIVRRMLEEAAPIADLRARDAPASFCRVIERGLARYPADRQQSALDLGRELRDARADAGTTPTPVNLKDATFPSAPPAPTGPRTAGGTVRTDARPGRTETALVVMLALLLVGAGITLAVRLGDREPPSATAVGGPGARPRVTGLTVAPTPDGPGFGDPLQISGVVVDRPVDRQLRVVLATVDRTRFDPQDVVAPREDGSWTMAVQLAIPTPEPTYRFSVLVVQVDAAGGRQLDDYITRAQATRDFTGLPVLPDGSEIVASTTLTLPRLRA